ncbi:plasmid mobilization relaxosome protein MobC [Parabacteroides sp. PF5-9]|uniref:plasmid mobilization protein n=1 Tax=Parabacteroides sp. PF5-9 TaxID=1742404 RepID=UPI002472F75A|nr:plasmid mobilization relaxosome protein MobC [Parabacteroides sp. PF5-9]MDH6358937.1 archaellum component FlaC [Parabacteroides sp. PF5-9]
MAKDNKNKYIRVRCTEEEYKKLQRQAKHFASFSTYLRTLIFSQEKSIVDPKTVLQSVKLLTTEINKLGTNVNQIAKFMNYVEKNNLISDEVTENLAHEVRATLNIYEQICHKINYLGIK